MWQWYNQSDVHLYALAECGHMHASPYEWITFFAYLFGYRPIVKKLITTDILMKFVYITWFSHVQLRFAMFANRLMLDYFQRSDWGDFYFAIRSLLFSWLLVEYVFLLLSFAQPNNQFAVALYWRRKSIDVFGAIKRVWMQHQHM